MKSTSKPYPQFLNLKVHLTPKNILPLNQIYFLFEAFGHKYFWICLNPRFSMPSLSLTWSVAWPSFRESGAAVADDVYPRTKHNGASVSSVYLLEKMLEIIYLRTKTSEFCLRIIIFFITAVRVQFQLERLRNKRWSSMFDNCVKSLLGALRAL